MKDTVELQEKISAEAPPTDNARMESSLLRQCMNMNKELRPVIKGALNQDYLDKYIMFSKNMEIVLAVVEEFMRDVDAILTTRSEPYQSRDKDI